MTAQWQKVDDKVEATKLNIQKLMLDRWGLLQRVSMPFCNWYLEYFITEKNYTLIAQWQNTRLKNKRINDWESYWNRKILMASQRVKRITFIVHLNLHLGGSILIFFHMIKYK